MKFRALLFLSGLLLSACGGNGAASTALAPTPTASGSAVTQPITAFGAISAFGSVFVNGVRYDISRASLTKDGSPAIQADLAVGHMALVKGEAESTGVNGSANSIDVEGSVVGNVASIDAPNNKLVVLGQTIIVRTGTSFSANITGGSLTGLAVGDRVEVSGNAAANGDINATRIEKEAGTSFQVLGAVAAINATAHTFKINALNVNYAGAMLDGFAAGHPANTDVVIVRGTVFASATTTLTAARVLPSTADPRSIAGHDTVEQEGLITRFASAADFDVAGKKVATNASTVFRDGTSADLGMNVAVEVHGTLDATTGTLTASVVTIEHVGVVELAAPATAVNKTAGTVTLLGVTVTLNITTRLEDKSSTHLQMFSINDLNANDTLLVRGYESPVGSGKVIATRLERLPSLGTVVYVRGPFSPTIAPQFKILGVVIDTTGATFVTGEHGSLQSAAFFTAAVGKIVRVRGALSGTTVTATQVAIASRDDD